MQPKGTLLIIGGAEDLAGQEAPDMETKNIKYKQFEILKKLLLTAKDSIAIVTAASRFQDKVRHTYQKAFERLHQSPKFIEIRSKHDCRDRQYLKAIENVGAVFFTGGDQSLLTCLLAKTHFMHLIKERYLNDTSFLVAGTSAGAMAMSEIMISSGSSTEALIANQLKLSRGFGLLKDAIIDSHFIKRGRFGRLAHALLRYPHYLGIGLGEDTALVIKKGFNAECRGSGMVVIMDGRKIKSTNIKEAQKGEPIFAENINVHLLVKGNYFSLRKRQFLMTEKEDE